MHASPDAGLAMALAGERVVLLGARAMHWPARSRLVIADLHLGKSHVFRQAGIAVPRGATMDDLNRLSALIAATQATELLIVGDVLHGPAAQAAWRDAWIAWREAHAGVDVAVLAGNHDRALDAPALGMRQLGQAWADGPFLFRHLPTPDTQGRHVIAGHVHPKTRVPGVPRSWPAFWLRPGITVLPAFSDFTGGHPVRGGQGASLVACVEGDALALGWSPPPP
ncbi:ligase-associated DNA damage response endonuclease PdeM [Achromobacter sp. 77]|uniref:ligase-associated DNA damage response endonuclease PdeM n=1 Tax=Achromobacter TaxID=222 RepID=UPI001D026DFA|nr:MULTISPECIES: ligase-associated DNA damage response endonuclease PdeM [Achromobacter]MCU6619282.1 ligase-associated DNA damage response endonuclease PdeM [Achromobacter mucicolens]UDG74359.1 ligase-associated DNA damage response endonuclease PdeM [Achromobacter sp. 77]